MILLMGHSLDQFVIILFWYLRFYLKLIIESKIPKKVGLILASLLLSNYILLNQCLFTRRFLIDHSQREHTISLGWLHIVFLKLVTFMATGHDQLWGANGWRQGLGRHQAELGIGAGRVDMKRLRLLLRWDRQTVLVLFGRRFCRWLAGRLLKSRELLWLFQSGHLFS